jgi:O-antigen ligase
MMTDNPHNQYLKTAIELGLVGLASLLWLFNKQWKAIQQLEGADLILARTVFLSFFLGCIFNSWFKNFTESYFYMLVTAYFIPIGFNKLKNE